MICSKLFPEDHILLPLPLGESFRCRADSALLTWTIDHACEDVRKPSPSPLPKGEGSDALLHLDIHNLAAKGAQDLLDGGVLDRGLARLLFRPARLFFG
jgi:hypothetical protein